MAKKENKKNKKNNLALETRIISSFSLLEFCRLDEQNLTKEDLDILFNRVQEINNLALEDEQALDIAVEHDLEQITSHDKLKERIQRSRVINTYQTLGYFGLCCGTEHEHLPNAQEIVATVLHNLNIKDADTLADKIFHKTLDDETATTLFTEVNKRKSSLIENLRTDMQSYDTQKQQNPLIESLRPDLEECTYSAQTKTLEIPFSCNKDDEIRQLFKDDVRCDFDQNIRHEFLRLCGQLMDTGRRSTEGLSYEENYASFKKLMTSQYGEQAIDQALNIKDTDIVGKDIETVRKEKFKAKGEEMYFRTVAALLSEKNSYNQDYNTSCNWTAFATKNISDYIQGLLNGYNNIRALALLDPNSGRSGKDLPEDATKNQYVSVHHGNSTVAASHDVTRHIYPELFNDKELNSPELKEEMKSLKNETNPKIKELKQENLRGKLRPILKQALETAKDLTNQMGGLMLVVGNEKHQSMEPKGKITVKPYPDNSIMAARIDVAFLNRINSQLPKSMQAGIQKYVNINSPAKTLDISVALPLPEESIWTQTRDKLKAKEKTQVNILQKHQRYSH